MLLLRQSEFGESVMPIMLRNRSKRAVAAKQASVMADQPQSPQPQIGHFTKPALSLSYLFSSPKFKLFTSKISPFDTDFALTSPTSILDANPSIFSTKTDKPNSYFEPTIPKPQRFKPPEAFGLADLVKTANPQRGNVGNSAKPVNKMVLFGSKLRVQIPSADFGTKIGAPRYPARGQSDSSVQARVLTGCSIPVSEMELSEDYTCVISHGPNPTTRHIFDNCVFVESNCSVSSSPPLGLYPSNSFLSFCYTCKKILDQKHNIYIYRGEKAFCSCECRFQEMLIDRMES
ncbi:PREDICTED: protein MARD1-like [Tarenaya hassleriana]|uniref:protein MARD1-like n=1 Tax=Tarenaya hassleriana TaxID=28532 RepID=UPI00053C4569|nr:PREDICTED: protein MARD1-like [Tarenaya hassleriana]